MIQIFETAGYDEKSLINAYLWSRQAETYSVCKSFTEASFGVRNILAGLLCQRKCDWLTDFVQMFRSCFEDLETPY